MARKRMVDPGIFSSRQFISLGNNQPHPQTTYLGTISCADDYGILELDPILLRSQIYPRSTCVRKTIERHIELILKEDLLLSYKVEGRTYAIHPNWLEYQKLDNPARPKLPFPPEHILAKCSPKTRDKLANASLLIEGKGREGE